MKLIKYIFVSVVMLFILSCNKNKCLKSTGKEDRVVRGVENFTGINVFDHIELVITKDTIEKVILEGGKNLLPFIKTEVVDGMLIVKNNNSCDWLRSYKKNIRVYVHYKKLNHFIYESSADVSATNSLKADTFTVEQWTGSGTLNIPLEVNHLVCKLHTGSGEMILTGEAHSSFVYLSGGAPIDCSGLQTKFVTAINKGLQDIFINVHEKLKVEIHHTGSVIYTGEPKIIEDKIMVGKGRLIQG